MTVLLSRRDLELRGGGELSRMVKWKTLDAHIQPSIKFRLPIR